MGAVMVWSSRILSPNKNGMSSFLYEMTKLQSCSQDRQWRDQDQDQDRTLQDQDQDRDQCWQDQDRDQDQKNFITSLTITIITVQYIPEKEIILQKEI